MKKKRKQAVASLSNLCRGANDPRRAPVKKSRKEKPQRTWFNYHTLKWVKDNWTSMQGTYNSQKPSPATQTKLDVVHTKVVLAIGRIENARPVKDVRANCKRVIHALTVCPEIFT